MPILRTRARRYALSACALILAAGLTGFLSIRPSNTRDWSPGQEQLPRVELNGNRITVHNVRNFEWRPDGTAVERWETRSYDLASLETVWFGLAPFDRENRGPAHTWLSFGFADSQFIAISVEARREEAEEYSLLRGALRGYEVMYVVADERDLIRLRTNVRDDDVYLYPIRTSSENARVLFVNMLKRANELHDAPEFYNTFTNNCTTHILDHANTVAPGRIPYGREVFLPGYADQLAHRLGLIEAGGEIDAVRARFLVNGRARAFADDPAFSLRIRAAAMTSAVPASR